MRRIVRRKYVAPRPSRFERLRPLVPYALGAAVVTFLVLFFVSAFWWMIRWEYAKWRLDHGTAHERSAHATMHVLRGAARQYENQFGRAPRHLEELRAAKLLDPATGSGHKDGYRFAIAATPAGPLFTADPDTDEDGLHFAAHATYRVRFASAPIADATTGEIDPDAWYLGK